MRAEAEEDQTGRLASCCQRLYCCVGTRELPCWFPISTISSVIAAFLHLARVMKRGERAKGVLTAYCTVLCCNVLYCTVLYCSVPLTRLARLAPLPASNKEPEKGAASPARREMTE